MLDWQWKEKVIPYWKEAAKFAREHGIKKLAFEMHPNFVVYNPKTLLRLREAAGEEIGANCDLSHLFWQGCDPVEGHPPAGQERRPVSRAHEGHDILSRERESLWRSEFCIYDGRIARGFGEVSGRGLRAQRRTVEGDSAGLYGCRFRRNVQH